MKQFFLILSGLALLTGCSSKNDSVEGPVQSRIRIAPSISRVTGLNFDTGDRIGLTIVKSGANYCENTPLRFDGTVFVSDDLFWYDDSSEKSNLTAYYPYLAEGAPASFTVRADQKLAADHEASDLLAATATDVVPSQTAVNMIFTHLLTKIVIDITNNSANTIQEVTLKGSRCTATVDLSTKSVQVDASSAETDIYPFPTVTAGRYEAILVPQRAALELEIQTSDGNRHIKTFQATDLQSGAEYAIEAVISNTNKIHASISGAVKGWEDGGAIAPVEDDLPEDSDLLEYAGVKYRIRQLSNGTTWMAENLRYIPEGKRVSSSPSDENGIWYPCTTSFTASSDTEYIQRQGLLYDLATAVGEPVTADNFRNIEGVQGICPEGWHLPTRADLESLIAVNSELGSSFFTYAGTRDPSGKYIGSLMSGNFSKGYLLCTSTESSVYTPEDLNYQYLLFSKSNQVNIIDIDCRSGMPVRCVKNATSGEYGTKKNCGPAQSIKRPDVSGKAATPGNNDPGKNVGNRKESHFLSGSPLYSLPVIRLIQPERIAISVPPGQQDRNESQTSTQDEREAFSLHVQNVSQQVDNERTKNDRQIIYRHHDRKGQCRQLRWGRRSRLVVNNRLNNAVSESHESASRNQPEMRLEESDKEQSRTDHNQRNQIDTAAQTPDDRGKEKAGQHDSQEKQGHQKPREGILVAVRIHQE